MPQGHEAAGLDPHIAQMLKFMADQKLPGLTELPLAQTRAGYRTTSKIGSDAAPAMEATRDLSVGGAAGELPARLYKPQSATTPSAGLVFFHGGGFVIGDLETHDATCRRLADTSGVRVLAVDYRLAPEHPFPAGQDDAVAATKWALTHAAELEMDPRRVAIGGDSAGAMLAAATAIRLRDEAEAGAWTGPSLAFQLLLYPGVMLDPPPPSMLELSEGFFLTRQDMQFFNEALHPDPATMAHKHARLLEEAPLHGLPPALVVTAGFDPLKDGGRHFAERMRGAGGEVAYEDHPGMIHGFYNFGHVSPVAAQAIADTSRKLGAALGVGAMEPA